jgi:hypothetical protein
MIQAAEAALHFDAASLRDRHEAGVIARRFQAAAASGEMRSFRERVPAKA